MLWVQQRRSDLARASKQLVARRSELERQQAQLLKKMMIRRLSLTLHAQRSKRSRLTKERMRMEIKNRTEKVDQDELDP